MAVKFDQIGSINMALVLALKNGKDHAAGRPISDYQHAQSYNYDLSYGLNAIYSKRQLEGSYVGTKYYCYTKTEIDMKKRIVHIRDTKDSSNPQYFYRLIHTAANPGLRDNSYNQCDLITDIP